MKQLPLILSILFYTDGFTPVRNVIPFAPSTTTRFITRCRTPFFVGLRAAQDDVLEERARSLFDTYANEGFMELSVLKNVPFIQDLMVRKLLISWKLVLSVREPFYVAHKQYL
jgi:hypothetical protein